MAAADAVPDVDGDHGRGPVAEGHDAQAVGQPLVEGFHREGHGDHSAIPHRRRAAHPAVPRPGEPGPRRTSRGRRLGIPRESGRSPGARPAGTNVQSRNGPGSTGAGRGRAGRRAAHRTDAHPHAAPAVAAAAGAVVRRVLPGRPRPRRVAVAGRRPTPGDQRRRRPRGAGRAGEGPGRRPQRAAGRGRRLPADLAVPRHRGHRLARGRAGRDRRVRAGRRRRDQRDRRGAHRLARRARTAGRSRSGSPTAPRRARGCRAGSRRTTSPSSASDRLP